jgi:NAD(P)-dependent dehydrogenase (short-subunit alcohol dehydrogenase family)
MKVRGKVLVVTGGGNGIGREVVLELLRLGARVAATDVNASALEETARLSGSTGELSVHPLDITDQPSVQNLLVEVLARHGQVDGLVNVAGIIQPFKRIIDLDYADIDRVMNVNFWGVIHTLKVFLPELVKRPEAHIVNVASMGAYAPVPGQTVYGASKAAVKLLTEGLYAELLDTNVGVTAVFPGATATNIAANSGLEMSQSSDGPKFKTLPAADAAHLIVEGIEGRSYHVFTGSDARMMDRLARYAPNRVAKIIHKQMKSLLDS